MKNFSKKIIGFIFFSVLPLIGVVNGESTFNKNSQNGTEAIPQQSTIGVGGSGGGYSGKKGPGGTDMPTTGGGGTGGGGGVIGPVGPSPGAPLGSIGSSIHQEELDMKKIMEQSLQRGN
jgi:hypothetical protein